MLGFDQVVAVTQDEAREELLEILDDVGFTATSWHEGSIPRALVDIGAFIWSEATKIAVVIKESGFNETAVGEALNRYSRSSYQNTQREARAEVHLVTLSCAAGEGPHTIALGAFSAKNTNGYVFTNIADDLTEAGPTYPAAYPAIISSGGTLQILLQAEQPGEDALTAPGDLETIITTLTGVTITADEVLLTGTNVESAESLRLRNSLKWALLPALGLLDDSVEALAREAAESVDRVVVDSSNPRGAGTLDVWITGTQGNVGTTDKNAVTAAIQRRIMHDPDGTALQVDDATLQPLNITGTVYIRAGYNWADDVLPAIEAALEAWRRTIPLGGFSYPSPGNLVPVNEIETVIRRVVVGSAEPVLTVKLTTPAVDVPVAVFAHVTAGTWTLTPVEVGE